jgi:hypothetical protein
MLNRLTIVSSSSAADVRYVPAADLAAVWPTIWHLVESVIDGCNVPDQETVYRRIASGQAHLFVCDKAMAVVRLAPTSEGLVCDIWFCAGEEAQAWLPGIDVIEAWAKKKECVRVRSEVRRGLVLPLKALGYTEALITMQKEL